MAIGNHYLWNLGDRLCLAVEVATVPWRDGTAKPSDRRTFRFVSCVDDHGVPSVDDDAIEVWGDADTECGIGRQVDIATLPLWQVTVTRNAKGELRAIRKGSWKPTTPRTKLGLKKSLPRRQNPWQGHWLEAEDEITEAWPCLVGCPWLAE